MTAQNSIGITALMAAAAVSGKVQVVETLLRQTYGVVVELYFAHALRQSTLTYGVVVELYFAHALRQSTLTVRSTGFDVHQDTEDFPFIEFTVVVKLTPDAPGSPHSRMRLVGAPRVFEYGAPAGSAGAFLARAFHASIEPDAGTSEHLKIAFFFRASTKGERRAKRGLSAAVLASGVEDELARRRRHVALELSNSNLEAQALAAEKKLAPWG